MGIMDKAKEAAMQAKASAEKMAQQGQAKVATMQHNRSEAELYRALGEAAYAEQRRGGSRAAVDSAVSALDQHFATPGPSASSTPPSQAGGSAPTQSPPAGDFKINDA